MKSTGDNRFDRNFTQWILQITWPGLFYLAVQRSAQHCFEQHKQLMIYCEALQNIKIKNQFKLVPVPKIPLAKQNRTFAYVACGNQIWNAGKRQLTQLINDVVFAKEEANPQFQLVNKVIRRYQDRLRHPSCFRFNQILPKIRTKHAHLPDDLGNLSVQENEHNLIFHWQDFSDAGKTNLPISIRFGYSGKVKHHLKRPREDIKNLARIKRATLGTKSIPLIFMATSKKVRSVFPVFLTKLLKRFRF